MTDKTDPLADSPTGGAALGAAALGVSRLSRPQAVLTWAEIEAGG